jgi:ParB-like nuclease domain
MQKFEKGFIDIPIKLLVKADWNYKEEDAKQSEKLKNNLKRNGQIENVIVRLLDTGFYEVANGNHRLDVFLELGYKTVHAYNLGQVSLKQAQRVAIETNETRFKSNPEKLQETLQELLEEFEITDLQETFSTDIDFNFDVETELDIDSFSDADNKANDLASNVMKAIMIEYEESHYKEAYEIISFWREKGMYIGAFLVEKLKQEKEKL